MIASLLQDDTPVTTLVDAAAPNTPEIIWSAIAPNLILMVGGVLLLTVVSLLRGRTPAWFYTGWTVVTAALSIAAPICSASLSAMIMTDTFGTTGF